MRRQIRASMLRFAKDIDAMRHGRPDWYAVAEFLVPFAAEQFPQLLRDDLPASRPAHRPPKENWYWLVHDVDLIRRQRRKCTVKEACRLLAKGEAPHRVLVTSADGRRRPGRIQSGRWAGMQAQTLEQRYYE
jgi:hypothetical protein